jgi:hypothetical protein
LSFFCRFLLVEYFTAELLAQSREKDFRARLVSMALACRHHKSFLKRLQLFQLLPKAIDEAVCRMQEGEALSPQVARPSFASPALSST